MSNTRRASVVGHGITADKIAAYLPANYEVIGVIEGRDPQVIIEGEDVAGWTLDDYVIPRLGSGLWFATEVDLP